jgi:hypothetical protein
MDLPESALAWRFGQLLVLGLGEFPGRALARRAILQHGEQALHRGYARNVNSVRLEGGNRGGDADKQRQRRGKEHLAIT